MGQKLKIYKSVCYYKQGFCKGNDTNTTVLTTKTPITSKNFSSCVKLFKRVQETEADDN